MAFAVVFGHQEGELQVGERWLLYIPWQSGYGSSGNSSIPGYSSLTFDVYLKGIV